MAIEKLAGHLQKAIEKAIKVKNPLADFPDFAQYNNGDAKLTIECKWKSDMDAKALKWAFKLAEQNVGPYYKASPMGWQPKVKQADLNKGWARYLIVKDEQKTPVAFVMFRFDMDYGNSVVYCYEIQIAESHRRKGLGRHLMHILETLSKKYEMEKVVLTALKNNPASLDFFTQLGYKIDENSPDASENCGYEILSKVF